MAFMPSPRILLSIANQNLQWKDVFGELIDNSLDADAKLITVRRKSGQIAVIDNGKGCADLEGMLTLGKHMPHSSTRLGRYGIGLKDAAMWLGGKVRIISVREGTRRELEIDLAWLSRQDEWPAKPTIRELPSKERGTYIGFSTKRQFNKAIFDSITNELSFVFTPALKQGREIVFEIDDAKWGLLPFTPPDLADVLSTSILVDGKTARVHVGRVPDGIENRRPGLNYTHRHRVIIPSTSMGCGDCSISRVFGWVDLDDGWVLTKNKDGISEHRDELAHEVHRACEPLFSRVKSESALLKSAEFQGEVNATFQGWMGRFFDVKAKRGDGDKEGAREPKNTGRKHKRAKDIQPGDKPLQSFRGGGVRVELCEPIDGESVGRVDPNGGRVFLHRLPRIKRFEEQGNHEALALLAVALVVGHEVFNPSGQQVLRGFEKDSYDHAGKFAAGIGRVLASATLDSFKAGT